MASSMRRPADWFLHDWVERLDTQRPPTPTPPRHASGCKAGRGGGSPPSPPRRAPRVPSPPRPSARRGRCQVHYGIQSAAPPHRLQARVTSPADHRNASAFRQRNPSSRSPVHRGLNVFNRFALLAMASDYEREFPVLPAATGSIDKEAKQRGESPIKHSNNKLRGGVRRAPQVQHVTKAVAEPAVKAKGDAELTKGESQGHAEAGIKVEGHAELAKGESERQAEAPIKAKGHAELAKGESEGQAEASIKVEGQAELTKGESEDHADAATKAAGDAKVSVKSDKAARNVPDLAGELNGQDFFVGSILVRCGPPVAVVAGGVEGCRRGGPGGGSGGVHAGGGDGCGGGGPVPDGGGGGVGGGGPADGGGGGGGGGPPGGGGGGPPPPQPPYPQRLPFARCQRAGCGVDALFFCSQCGLVCCPEHVCPDCTAPLSELPAPRLSVPQVQIYQPFQYPPTLQLFVGAFRVGNRVSHYFARPQDVFGHGDVIAGEAQHFDMQGFWMVRSVREAPCILRRVNMFPEPQFYSW
ncbi:hypothetical protein CFC21_008840 [Triticum aestivum]|uniref:Uncharacterized protein n=2 Tax=Triticum aestivum TaxID=4565 RepID=A0A9R1DH13_WHEAT|nr:translation initiation factor IF-2-like isoform X2 [Triticum aestivum]KAF6991793.1 hypothetical protein CFC21_008840 [Triticum aestivum]